MSEKKGFIGEFKEFIARGNVMDMAVGIIVGSAFTAIVTSLVGDIFTPIIGLILGGINFAGMAITIGEASITFGNFIQAIINFLLTAFVVFCMVKIVNGMRRKKEEEAPIPEPEPEPTPDPTVELLKEIRDLLQK